MRKKNLLYYFSIVIFLGLLSCSKDVQIDQVSKKVLFDQAIVFPIGSKKVTGEEVVEKRKNVGTDAEKKEIYYIISRKNIEYTYSGTTNIVDGGVVVITTTEGSIVDLNPPKDLANSTLWFKEPIIELIATSNLGVDLEFDFQELKTYMEADLLDYTKHKSAEFTPEGKKFIVEKATKKGETKISTHILDKDNAKTFLLFEHKHLPEKLEYKFNQKINTSSSDFLLDEDGKVTLDVTVKLPLYLTKESFVLINDTLKDISKKIGDKEDEKTDLSIAEASLIFDIENSIPVGAILDLKFVDSLGVEIDTDIQKQIKINPPKVYEVGSTKEGQVKEMIPQRIEIKLTAQQWEVIKKTDRIEYTARVDSKHKEGNEEKEEKIHITPENFFQVKAGFYLKAAVVKEI